MGARLNASDLKALLEGGISTGVFSAAQAALLTPDGGLVLASAGRTAYDDAAPTGWGATAAAAVREVDDDTRFDLASVTKAVVTAPLTWYAFASGALAPDTPASRFLPDWAGADGVRVRHLLTHTSGLPAWLPLYEGVLHLEANEARREALWRALLETTPEHLPGERALYSDIGYILLGRALERALGAPLDALARAYVLDPLGMRSTRFVRHLEGDQIGLEVAVAATEATRVAAMGPSLRGQVHDEHAHILGGVAGHAGLFGTARDLAAFGAALLAADGASGSIRELPIGRHMLRWALSADGCVCDAQGRRLGTYIGGFDSPSGELSTAGRHMSREPVGACVGHLGFTGTSLWVDRRRRMAVALLTNRVHPTREGDSGPLMRRFRVAFHDAVSAGVPVISRIWPAAVPLSGTAGGPPVALLGGEAQRALDVAIEAAVAAGAGLRQAFSAPGGVERHYKGSVDLVTSADLAAESTIITHLRAAFPDHAILAEEGGGDDVDAVGTRCRWIIDPLDGTTNFSHNVPHFAVLIALEVEGKLQLGVTYDPMRDELFVATRGGGAFLNGRRLRVSGCETLNRALVATGFPYDRQTHPANNADTFAAMLRVTQGGRRLGSAGLDMAYVAAGRFDLYWEKRLKYWDLAAGMLLVEEAGGLITRYDGSAADRSADQIVASGGLVHEAALAVIDGRT